MKVAFMGTPEFAAVCLEAICAAGHEVALVVTQPDRPAGRSREPVPPPVKTLARKRGLPLIQPGRMDEPGALKALRDAAPEAIAVAAFGHILKREILDLPRLVCVNAHASLLPKLRGAAPIQWAIAGGETETGVTAMLMDEGMDTGPVLLQRKIPISPDDTGGTLHDKLAPIAGELLVEALKGLDQGSLTPIPQDESLATYAPLLKKSDGKLDFRQEAETLARRVRAFDPWPGTFAAIKGEQVKITRAKAEPGGSSKAPGRVARVSPEGIVIACGRGLLRALELQPAGKRRMSAAEFLAGRRLAAGDVFE